MPTMTLNRNPAVSAKNNRHRRHKTTDSARKIIDTRSTSLRGREIFNYALQFLCTVCHGESYCTCYGCKNK